MNRIKLICVVSFLVFGVAAFLSNNGFTPVVQSYSSQPPPGMTGAPGEQNCSLCHDETGPGMITINAPANYVPGQTYQIQVQHSTSDSTRMRWGFEMTALDGTNSGAGTFTDTSPYTQQDFGDGRWYIEHTSVGTFPGTPNGATWTFDWNAPATNIGPVTFYAAGNQANNNNNPSGDQIFLTTTVSQPAGSTATATSTPTSTATSTPTATPTASPNGSISGTVTYLNASAPPKFVSNVTLSGAGSPNVSTTTAAPGAGVGTYTLTGFGAGSYIVTPTKVGGVNGISSFDAARIAQHVAAIPPFLNANQLLAADTSGNGIVSSFDAGQLAQWVVSTVGGQTGTWKFQPVNRTYSSVTNALTGENYDAILIGEVTGNWNNTAARAAIGGPTKSTTINAPNIVTKAGDEILVPVEVQGIANRGVISYEFDLRYDPSVIQPTANSVDLARTVSRGLSVAVNAKEPGLLRVVVYGAMPIDNDGVLLNLRFTAVGATSSVSPISFERMMFNEGESSVEVTNGNVELF